MSGRPEQAAIQLKIEQLKGEDGVEKLIAAMDKLFLPYNYTQQVFNALDAFLEYKRPADLSMEDYCREFHYKKKMAEQMSNKADMFDDGVLGYFLLKNSGLDQNSMTLIRATVTKLELSLVEGALKRTFGTGSGTLLSPSGLVTSAMSIKQEVMYNRHSSSETDQSGYCSSRNQVPIVEQPT